MAKTVRKLFGLGALVAVIGAGVWAGKTFSHITGTSNLKKWWDFYDNPKKFFPGKDQTTILLIGKDYQYDKLNQLYTGKSSRADSIMLLTLDFKTRHVTALSIPRDTRVHINGFPPGKINATFSGVSYPKKGGPDLLRSSVEDLTGIYPEYYLALKPDAVGKLVEEIGGVEVELLDAIEYNDHKAGLHVKLPKGKVTITKGNDAVGYARYREIDALVRNPDGTGQVIGKMSDGNPLFRLKPARERAELNKCLENGDTRRMVRQQQLIRAMMAAGKQPKNLIRANQIIDTAFAQFDTNLDREKMTALASLFREVKPDQVVSATLAGDFEKRKPYLFIPDRRKAQAQVQWLVYGDESAANKITTVAVLNGTKVSGAARRAADLLKTQGGFDAKFSPEPPREVITETQIWFTKASNKPRADKISQMLGGGKVQKDTAPDTTGTLSQTKPDIRVVLGPDIAGRLGEQSAQR